MEETSVVGVVFDINMPIAWLNHILRSDAAFGVSDLVLNVLPALAIETGAEWITTATTRVLQGMLSDQGSDRKRSCVSHRWISECRAASHPIWFN